MLRLRVGLIAALLCALPSSSVQAFCGFYVSGAGSELFNNATQVVLMRSGTRTVMSMQNDYQGPPSDFAMVVPVPVVLQKDNVKTLPADIFGKVDKLAAPRLVEYWEQDPCAPPPAIMEMAMAAGAPRRARMKRKGGDLGVTVEAQFKVGEYEVVILSAKESGGLDTWLRQEKYKIPEGAEPLLRPYVAQGSKFFVAKVDVKKVKFVDGRAQLSPLRFHFDSQEFRLPVRLGMINSSGTQDLVVHILAQNQRYEVANYPNATIPTNLEVKDEVRERFGEFYAALLDDTLRRKPGAVVTEYSWDSASCDPCPTPPLTPRDLATLGADVLVDAPPDAVPPPGGGPIRRRIRRPRGMVLTRLHARYGKNGITDDLVFRPAPPIVGGREHWIAEGKIEEGARPDRINNFQGRYIIRHPWKGAIACENPRRGIWGGPQGDKPIARPAIGTAFAKRGALRLASVLQSPLPGGAAPVAEPKKPAPEQGAPTTEPKAVEKPPVEPAPPATADDDAEEKKGCSLAGAADASDGVWWMLAALWLFRRRRLD